MHNHENGSGRSMMWMMVLCCALPFLAIVFWGVGGRVSGLSPWATWVGIIIMIAVHLFMMSGMHRHSEGDASKETDETTKKSDNKDSKSHPGGGCCH